MPCIQIHTNRPVEQEKAERIKTELGRIITFLPDKSEQWLLVELLDNSRIWFHGEGDRPFALVQVKVWGNHIDREGSERMTKAVCELLNKELSVAPTDVYVRYLATPDWGWNSANF